jgi:two-component system, NarL family, invasion response regulator UvrY
MNILIADDHAIVRKGLIQILLDEYPSALIGEASQAEELIYKLYAGEWDVVICDQNMPGRSGIEAIHDIKGAAPGIPVLIMSMLPEEQYALRAFKAGASGFLAKETIHYDLIKAVQTVLIGRKFVTPSIAEKLAGSINDNDEKQVHELLSEREFEVFKLLVNGKTNSCIADQLSLSASTVSTYRSRIFDKMNMHSIAELTRYAAEQKLY